MSEDNSTSSFGDLKVDDLKRLKRLLDLLRMIDGWCRVNRWIGKFIIIGCLGALFMMSQGVDALRNLIGFFLKASGKN